MAKRCNEPIRELGCLNDGRGRFEDAMMTRLSIQQELAANDPKSPQFMHSEEMERIDPSSWDEIRRMGVFDLLQSGWGQRTEKFLAPAGRSVVVG